jgi:NADH-quinone oxidoreductase subunit C
MSESATSVAIRPEALKDALTALLGERVQSVVLARGEVTVTVAADQYLGVMQTLRDAPEARFEQLLDLCGMDYAEYGDGRWEGLRFAAVSHLLSVSLNQRVRVRVFCPDDDFPVVASVAALWNSANWYEREAFDLRACGNALRRRASARGLRARDHRAARDHAARDPRRQLRGAALKAQAEGGFTHG